ncbi:MAG: aminotransferase class I/II-fold pyridoxal phosphate-dependent enzyme [Candidatus Hodarchaeota archaeon]
MVFVNERVKMIKYAIRDIVVSAEKLEKQGMKMLYLNIGDPIKYDFDTPEYMKEAIIQAVRDGYNGYSHSKGVEELRAAIVEKEKNYNDIRSLTSDDIIITAGISEALAFVMAAIAAQGEEILIPGPSYPPYISYAKFFGIEPVTYRCVEEDGWQPDIDDLRSKISDKTRALVVINPNNPCGSLYSKRVVKQMIDIAGENDLLLLSDEIYDRIVYEDRTVSTAAIAGDLPVIGFNGFSKVYLVPGWRLGYMYFHDPEEKISELREHIEKEGRIRLCASAPAQHAGIVALKGPQDHVKELVDKLRKRRDLTYKRLNEIEGLSCAEPKGAFYAFPKIEVLGNSWKDDKDFVLDLLAETGVVVVFGSGFCETYGAGHFRMVFLPPPETLESAFDKIEAFIRSKA